MCAPPTGHLPLVGAVVHEVPHAEHLGQELAEASRLRDLCTGAESNLELGRDLISGLVEGLHQHHTIHLNRVAKAARFCVCVRLMQCVECVVVSGV